MRGFLLMTALVLGSIGIGVSVTAGIDSHPSRQAAATPTLPPCTDLSLSTEVPHEKQITLAGRSGSKLVAKVYCTAGHHWFVSERVGGDSALVYQQPAGVPVDNPVGVVSFFFYSPKALPVALVEMGLGASATTYKLFANDGHRLAPIQLSSTDPSGRLAGGNAALHGEGVTCTAVGQDRFVVTQSSWEAEGNIGSNGSPSSKSKVRVFVGQWTIGGSPLHELLHGSHFVGEMSYAKAQAYGQVHC